MRFLATVALLVPSAVSEPDAASLSAFMQDLSTGLAFLLIAAYGLGLVFSLRTHPELFASAGTEVLELKRQIAAAGDVFVKEYVDDGYSGTLLDRPGLEALRRDVRTPLFDAVYFLDTDRIDPLLTLGAPSLPVLGIETALW